MSHWTYLVYFIYMYILYRYTYKGYCYSESTASIIPPFRNTSVLQEKSKNESSGLWQAQSIADQELVLLLIVNLPKFLQDNIFIVDPTTDVT